jgi:hypothetical protein
MHAPIDWAAGFSREKRELFAAKSPEQQLKVR